MILFFGYIRRYKGLDILFDAIALLKNRKTSIICGDTQKSISSADIRLMVAGEFFKDEEAYNEQIAHLGIADVLELRTSFITDSEVKYYLSAADFVIQPYREATQSGVTPLAYHFEVPMLVTNVGGLADMVPDGKVGVVASPDAESVANHIEELYRTGAAFYMPGLREEKKKYSWKVLTDTIRNL